MTLRPYQEHAVQRVREAMRSRRVVLVVPTGGGKTRIGADIARRCIAGGRRVLWLAHRAELVDQAAATLAGLGLLVGARSASAQTPPNPFAPVQVATIQTLLARNDRPAADLVVFDECHHAAADEYLTFMRDYEHAFVLGLTATPERSDGRGLDTLFNALVVGASVKQLTNDGHLVPCEVIRPGRFLQPGEIAQSPVDAFRAHAGDRPTIVFARGVELAQSYADEFRMAGVQAACITGDMPWGERLLYLEAFKRGDLRVLVNVFCLTEGFDAPATSCVIVARGCSTAGMYLQMVGRALRPAPGKTDALVVDLRGVSHEFGRPDDDRVFSLDGKGIRLRDQQIYCPVCGAPREAGEGCSSCGWQPAGEGMKPDRITNDPLVKYAVIRQDDDGARVARLAKWIAACRARGHKEGAAMHKFKAVYGAWPTPDLIAAARGAA